MTPEEKCVTAAHREAETTDENDLTEMHKKTIKEEIKEIIKVTNYTKPYTIFTIP